MRDDLSKYPELSEETREMIWQFRQQIDATERALTIRFSVMLVIAGALYYLILKID